MSIVYVMLRLPNGDEVYVPPGSVIGRLVTSPVSIDDPKISEAHVLVTHRGGSLWMISLQGKRIGVEGERPRRMVRLAQGQVLELSDGYCVRVVAVSVPAKLPRVEVRLSGQESWQHLGILDGREYYSITAEPALYPGIRDDALLRLVSGIDSWVLFGAEAYSMPIEDIGELDLGSWQLRFTWVDSEAAGIPGTLDSCRLFWDYEIQVSDALVSILPIRPLGSLVDPPSKVLFTGVQAKLMVALLERNGSHPWKRIGRKVWADDWSDKSVKQQERRWHTTVHRIRKKLLEAKLDPNLLYRDPQCPGRYGFKHSERCSCPLCAGA